MATDRFDLENAIMQCWALTDDLDLIIEDVWEGSTEEPDIDEIGNALIGLQRLHALRMNKLFNVFSELVETGQFTDCQQNAKKCKGCTHESRT
jgi:hypothetical protein